MFQADGYVWWAILENPKVWTIYYNFVPNNLKLQKFEAICLHSCATLYLAQSWASTVWESLGLATFIMASHRTDVFPDLHHKMSKKIAQLTKVLGLQHCLPRTALFWRKYLQVIYQLNSRNEDNALELQRYCTLIFCFCFRCSNYFLHFDFTHVPKVCRPNTNLRLNQSFKMVSVWIGVTGVRLHGHKLLK